MMNRTWKKYVRRFILAYSKFDPVIFRRIINGEECAFLQPTITKAGVTIKSLDRFYNYYYIYFAALGEFDTWDNFHYRYMSSYSPQYVARKCISEVAGPISRDMYVESVQNKVPMYDSGRIIGLISFFDWHEVIDYSAIPKEELRRIINMQ